MKTIIKQSADGIFLRVDNKLDTTQGKVFINNHEITDIDTFFKVAEENTRLLEQVKKQKEVIDKAMIELDTIINDLEKHGDEAPVPSKEELCKVFNILKEVSE